MSENKTTQALKDLKKSLGYPDLVIKQGDDWYLVGLTEYGCQKETMGPYPNEAGARLAELIFWKVYS